jgi:hypothetical protein
LRLAQVETHDYMFDTTVEDRELYSMQRINSCNRYILIY